MIEQNLSPIILSQHSCIHVENQQEEEVQEAKNSGLRSILKQFTSFPVEAEISMSKQKQQQINSKKKGSRLYTEFQASQ